MNKEIPYSLSLPEMDNVQGTTNGTLSVLLVYLLVLFGIDLLVSGHCLSQLIYLNFLFLLDHSTFRVIILVAFSHKTGN